MTTTIVAEKSCRLVGHSTFRSSPADSATKPRKPPRRSRRAPVWLLGWPTGLISRRRWRARSGGGWEVFRLWGLAGALCGCLVVLALAARAGLAGHRSASLPVQRVRAAPAAVLLRLEAVRR